MNTVHPKQGDRLRRAPAERFVGHAHDFNLAAMLAELRAEDHPATDGHRQITLLHRASAAHVLFAFEPGGKLDRHQADGEVSIHVIQGCISVAADGRDYSLESGSLLMLGAGVPHDVRASETSAMLLTVFMAKEAAAVNAGRDDRLGRDGEQGVVRHG